MVASWALAGLAVIPVLSMLALVRSSSILQWNDYWDILPRVTNADGSFDIAGVATFQNEHPVMLASVIYWLNARMTGGSNIALGHIVVVMAMAQVVLLAWALPRQISSVPLRRALFTVMAASLLFAPRGAHNFMLAMSGTAWLSANLFAVATIFVLWRRPLLALPGAVLATISYGTGLLIWPMLVLLCLLEAKPRRWVITTTLGCVGATGLHLAGSPAGMAGGSDHGVYDTARRVCMVLGSPLTVSAAAAAWLGLGLLTLAGLALARAWQEGMLAQLAPWIALLGYALGGAILIGLSRGGLSWEVALASRYVSLGALAWVATLVLAQSVIPLRYVLAGGAVAVASVSTLAGSATIQQIRRATVYSDETAIALRLGALPRTSDWRFNRDAVPLMQPLHHYPFDDDFTFDCGYLGQWLDPTQVLAATNTIGHEQVKGFLGGYVPSPYYRAVRLQGWLVDRTAGPLSGVRCVVIVDELNYVVGASVLDVPPPEGQERPDGVDQFSAVAWSGLDQPASYRAVAVTGDGGLVSLDGQLAGPGPGGVQAPPSGPHRLRFL